MICKGLDAEGDVAREVAPDTALIPLTPRYESSEHGTYVKAIEAALNGEHDSAIRNIALTGSYGVGKSSILQEVAERHQKAVVQVSLSTLGLADVLKSDSASGAAVTKTNLIQKEIVKQLLYREDPEKMPGSRYRRIGRFKLRRQAVQATLVGLAVTLVFFLAGWTQQLVVLAAPYVTPGIFAHLAVLIAATAFALVLEWLFHNRLQIERISAGATTITLSGESATYFDEYLDEIVYFFDVTKRDIVIFEDIDRFDDPHIFETLRALNSLLNRAGQLKGRSIRFIYAIKDSIFDDLGVRAAREEGDIDTSQKLDAVDCEIARANRTKFFDLVIPVVPFITHRSARDLMDKVMTKSGSAISSELIDLAARHLVDMRLIKNIHNEFVIFRDRVLRGEGSRLGLSEDVLFAMMLYKSTHLSDFEEIKFGKSKIDLLYSDARQLVTQNMARLSSEEAEARRRLGKLDSVATRSEALGAKLIQYVERLEGQLSASRTALRYAGANVTAEHLQTPEYWEGFLSGDQPLESVLRFPNGHQAVFSVTRQDAEADLGLSLSLRDWQTSDSTQLRDRLKRIRKDRDFLRSADIGELMEHDEFMLTDEDGSSRPLRDLAVQHLESELALQLVQAGYIDRNFTLYTSTYYTNRVSSQATNFIIHSVDPNVMDPHFTLEPDDVEAVLRERGESVLRQRGMYNIAVLDYLLKKSDDRVEPLTRSLMTFGENERQFFVSYFSNGNQSAALVGILAMAWPRTFAFIIEEAELDDAEVVRLVDVALKGMADGVKYDVDQTVRAYFEDNYMELAALASDETTSERAALIAKLLKSMDARLPDLSPLGVAVREAIVAESRYTVSRDNLLLALEGPESLALDEIRERDDNVYLYVLDNLPSYLDALRAEEPAVAVISPEAFGPVLKDVAAHAEDELAQVISLSAPECQAPSLADVPEAAWPWLADGNRFPATFGNVQAYVGDTDEVDARLASLLEAAGSIEAVEGVEDSAKATLSKQILEAGGLLPDSFRVQLVRDLALKEWLPLEYVPTESGQLLGLLISDGIVADDEETFALAVTADWKTREFAISKSEEFVAYMTPLQVPLADVALLIRSELISDDVKLAVLERSSEFAIDADRATLTALAQYALVKGASVPATELTRWARARVEAQLIVQLLEGLLSEISPNELVPVLEALGGNYLAASARNGKRPKLANTASNLALVERLERLGIASSHEVSTSKISVNMRKAP